VISSIVQAIGLFIATNIDDVVILSLFFARGQGQPGTTRRILVGQYLGFLGILGAAVAVAFGAQILLPEAILPYFGLIPLGLGVMSRDVVLAPARNDTVPIQEVSVQTACH
jgi:cadmium resistance protein CadD (predicted permease)